MMVIRRWVRAGGSRFSRAVTETLTGKRLWIDHRLMHESAGQILP
jgi:hypothetical protein